jgi:acyl-CoA thioester hydrolase
MTVSVPPGAVTTTFRVRYFECDQMQVAHHAHYFVWFEMGRAAFCRARGIDYSQMERDGLYLPVVEARCRYLASAHYDEELRLHVSVAERKRRTVRFTYLLMREDTVLAEAETYQMLIAKDGKSRPWPEAIAALFAPNPE